MLVPQNLSLGLRPRDYWCGGGDFSPTLLVNISYRRSGGSIERALTLVQALKESSKKEDRFVKIRDGYAGAGVIHVRRFYLAAFFVVALLHQEAFLNLLP